MADQVKVKFGRSGDPSAYGFTSKQLQLSQKLPKYTSVCIMIRVSANYHWAKMTSVVFMLVVIVYISVKQTM